MARICFTWELGQGFGHLVPYLNIIRRLVERGDEVAFLARDAKRADTVFAGLPIHIEQIVPGITPADKSLPQLRSYAEILHNVGFYAPDPLARQVQPWLEKFTTLAPDVLIVDHSPTALLANRIFGRPLISAGTGFTVPPRSSPMKAMRYWNLSQPAGMVDNERSVLDVTNAVLRRAGAPQLAAVSDLLAADVEWLLSFAELDHYGVREGARYLGRFPAASFGEPPRWEAAPGPKIFAYLSAARIGDAFAAAVRELEANLCIYAPNLGSGEMEKLPTARTRRVASPVNLELAAAQCQVAVSNGSLNTVAGFLRAGRSQLVLPDNLERYMVGRRLELIGAGLVAPLAIRAGMSARLRGVLMDRSIARAAEHFSDRYRTESLDLQVHGMLVDIDRLQRRNGMGSGV
ncbi:MAG TPA: hypothetical protein QF901_07290 [Gammaproteobacteria bacterium]|nr:hypothetical protein [Gammaproteobacteria bacterium]